MDRREPTPLYHRISESIRYEIATGVLTPGTRLPPLHRAAERWGVNLHTVRRAYKELAVLGLVETRIPSGTVILGGTSKVRILRSASQRLSRFLERTTREARERFGLSSDGLADLLLRPKGTSNAVACVTVVECSDSQAHDLSAQIENRWQVAAKPWTLSRAGEPPPGCIIGTYFHYSEIRRRWPARIGDLHFVAIRPDADLWRRVRSPFKFGKRLEVILCERDEAMASNMAADLRASIPEGDVVIRTFVGTDPAELLDVEGDSVPVLFAPRLWGRLSQEFRAHPRAFEVRFIFDPSGFEAVAKDLDWTERSAHSRADVALIPAEQTTEAYPS